jgi:uncharacterized protein
VELSSRLYPRREVATIAGATVEPSFVADAMLGRLARWLRVLGFDTVYDVALHDRELVELAAADHRVLLTRDRHLVTHLRPKRFILVTSDAPLAQLREVLHCCAASPRRALFTRCLVCNTLLREATPAEVRKLVPERARELAGRVLRCPGCGRVFWPGSHVRRMRSTLAAAFPEGFDQWLR